MPNETWQSDFTGELLRDLTIDPSKDYQPRHPK
jgi:hypothetical protein